MKKMLTCAVLVPLGIYPQLSCAAGEQQAGIEGTVGIGMIVASAQDNLDPRASKKLLNSLGDEADRKSFLLPFVLPDLKYDFGKPGGSKLYLNAKPVIDDAGGFAIGFGSIQPLNEAGTADFGVFANPFDRVWKNPYLTGVGRESTSSIKYGAKVGLADIFHTGVGLNVIYMYHDVDDDVIGELHPDLARDGAVYALSADYCLLATPVWGVTPRLSISRGEYDGDSNSYVKGRVEVEGRYSHGRLTLLPQAFYSHTTYDETDPIFDKTRKNDGYGTMLIASFTAPFGLNDWALQAIAGYGRGDSNITFYDTEALSIGFMMTYRL